MRSMSAGGIVAALFAVAMKNTWDRSKGMSR